METWRGTRRGRQVITIYVNNIAEKLHWKGLWLAFSRHGEVLDAFIANKRNKEGKKFGFVRTSSKADANRMVERMNNFRLFGSKTIVSLARFQTRQSFWRRVRSRTRNDNQMRENVTNKEAGGRISSPETEKKERLAQLWGDFEAFGENLNCSVDCEKMKVLISTNQEQSIRDVVELEVGNYIYVVRIVEAGFTDNSSIKVIVDKDRTPQKQRNFSTSEGSSSSDSRSPVNGDTERSQEIEESLKTCYLGTHPNHDKEDFALGNASSLENQEINWAEHLFKNKRAHEEKGEVRAGKASFENSVGKDLSALEEGEADNKETGLFSNHSKALSNVNNPSETLEGQNVIADRSLGEKRDTRLPIRIAREEAQQVEQGEEEPFSSLDRDENWSKAERVFFPELVLKKSTKKEDTPLAVECLLHEGPVLTNVTSSVNAAGKWDGSQLTRALPVHYLCLISVVQPPNMALGDDSGGVSLGRTTTCSLLD
ncbi:hypothetical protein V6N13_032372 [Hibiscus sabdariffa]